MTTTDLLIPASVAVVWLLGAVSVWRVSRRRRAAVSWTQNIGRITSVTEDARGLHVSMSLDEHAETMLRMMGALGDRS